MNSGNNVSFPLSVLSELGDLHTRHLPSVTYGTSKCCINKREVGYCFRKAIIPWVICSEKFCFYVSTVWISRKNFTCLVRICKRVT